MARVASSSWTFLPRAPSALLGLGVALAGMGTGCNAPEVTYQLRFPSEETFLMSRTARVEIYDGSGEGEQSPDAICRALSAQQPASVTAVAASGARDVCEFLDGLVLRNIDTGRLVFAASAVDAQNRTILSGCAVLDLDDDAQTVEIQLSTLPNYPDAPTPECATVEAKCGGDPACGS